MIYNIFYLFIYFHIRKRSKKNGIRNTFIGFENKNLWWHFVVVVVINKPIKQKAASEIDFFSENQNTLA